MGAFSVFKDKRAKRKKPETPTVQTHYTKLARRAALIRYVCMIFVVVFAVYSFSFHSDEITMANFRYMLKFINLGDDADAPAGTLIAFDGNEGNRGLIYKGDLAILNEGGLTITGWDGEVLHKSAFSFNHPKMEQDGNYLYCYDLGGKELKIFNSYQQLSKTPTFDYPIYGLSTSNGSNFAVISSAKGYRSAVFVYNNNFLLRYSAYFGDKYVAFADISDDGNEFIVAAYNSKNGTIVTTVSKFRIDTKDAIYTKEYYGEMPLGLQYTDNGYCLTTSDSSRTFNAKDELISKIPFEHRRLLSGKVYGSKRVITYAMEGLSGGTEVVIYRGNGSIEYSKSFPTSLSDTTVCGNKLYTLSPGVLTECDMETGTQRSFTIPTSYSTLVPDGDRLILFSENQAEYFNASNFD